MIIVSDRMKRLAESYDPEILSILKKVGIEDGTRVEVFIDGRKYKGKIIVEGEDPVNKPVIWFKGKGSLYPLPDVSHMYLMEVKK